MQKNEFAFHLKKREMKRNFLIILALGLLLASFSTNKKTLEIVVHRGANKLAPENTMAATQKCIELGVEYVEIDVRESKDGILYILHDKTLDRTTNGSGPISEMHSTQIDQLDAGSWFSEDYKGERVPRLESYMNEIKGKVKIYFDVKSCDLKKLIALVYKCGYQDDCFFWFSNDKKAREFRALDKHIALKMSVKKIEDLDSIMEYTPQLIECSIDLLTPQVISFCNKNNLKIMLNVLESCEEKNYQAVIDSPADLVNLNCPDIMIALMK
jgi:glycerophosphoryl diester phosphodiesterase